MSITRVTNTPSGFVESEALEAHMAEAPQVHIGPSSRVINGALSITAGRGIAQEHGYANYSHGLSHMGSAGGSVMATRQRVNGVDTVELVPGVPGTRTHIDHALRDGLIRQIGQGIFEDVKEADGSQRVMQTAQPQASSDEGGAFNADEVAAWGEVTEGLHEGAIDAAVAGLAAAMANGGSLDRVALRLSQNTGMSLAAALQRIELAEQVQEAALARALDAAGVQDIPGFYAAARANPQRLTNAVMQLVHNRDAGHFVTWAREWSGNGTRRAASSGTGTQSAQQPSAFDADTLESLGFETATTRTGALLCRPQGSNGRWVPAADLGGAKR